MLERTATIVERWLVSVTDTFGLPRPVRVESHYAARFMASRVLMYYTMKCGNTLYIEHLFDDTFFRDDPPHEEAGIVFEEIAVKLALDARIPIAEEL